MFGSPFLFQTNSGSGSGGAGSALIWSEQGNAPLKAPENNFDVYFYQNGLSQELYSAIRIPSSYTPGSPIKLLVEIYSPDTSGNILLRSQSTLIRAEVDEVTSTTNQRTSTNSAITMSSSNDNEPQKVELDLSSTSGQVNSVAVSPGDILKVKLYRDTDTATSDLRFLIQSAEVTFV